VRLCGGRRRSANDSGLIDPGQPYPVTTAVVDAS
jgi:hypothetical protein